MLDYKLLEALAAVIDAGGFDKAARVLGITQSAVSQRIKLLEDQAGRLLVTRALPPSATAEGRVLLKHYIQVKSLEADLDQAMKPHGSERHRIFSVGINADSLATWFLPAVSAFIRDNRILLDLKVDDQDQTHKLLRDGEVMGCISSKQSPVQGCRVTRIGTMNYRMAAAPEFCRQYFPRGPESADLSNVPAVVFNRKDDLHSRFFARHLGRNADGIPIHYIPASGPFVRSVLSGLAYGMIPDLQANPFLESGELIDLFPGAHVRVPLFWHRWNLGSRLLSAFSKTIVKNAVIC